MYTNFPNVLKYILTVFNNDSKMINPVIATGVDTNVSIIKPLQFMIMWLISFCILHICKSPGPNQSFERVLQGTLQLQARICHTVYELV